MFKFLSKYLSVMVLRRRGFSLLLVSFLLFYSQYLFAMHWSPFAGRYYCPEINNSYECALLLEQKIKEPFVNRISEKTLEIILLSGKIRSFTNVDDDPTTFQIDETLAFAVLEVVGNLRYVVLVEQFGEGLAFSLLDRKANIYHELKGYPVFSPDGKRLLVAYSDFSGFSPTVLQIYRVMEGAIELEYQADLGDEWSPDWGADAITWQSSSIITFTESTIDCSFHEVATCESKMLKRDEKSWGIF